MSLFSKLLLSVALFYSSAQAEVLAPRQAHPIASQHMLPAPEKPGWKNKRWFHIEVTQGNFWNSEAEFENLNTGKTLSYVSDFEETLTILQFGQTLNDKWAFNVELPYHARHEGSTSDDWIDKFHRAFHFSRYRRNLFPEGRVLFSTSTDSVRRGPYHAPSGTGNIKFHFKYWAVQKEEQTGLSLSTHFKLPVSSESKGLTSGSLDITQMIHLGFLLNEHWLLFLNAGITYAPKNWMFDDWPRRKMLWSTDASIFYKLSSKWTFGFSQSVYSPLMNKSDLRVIYNTTNPQLQKDIKMSSGYNGLLEVRGLQTFSATYHFTNNNSLKIYFVEDWWLGDKNKNGDPVYSHNQPDAALGLQAEILF